MLINLIDVGYGHVLGLVCGHVDPKGERTPVGIRMTEPPASFPAVWNFCGEARRFKAAVIGARDVPEELEVRRVCVVCFLLCPLVRAHIFDDDIYESFGRPLTLILLLIALNELTGRVPTMNG